MNEDVLWTAGVPARRTREWTRHYQTILCGLKRESVKHTCLTSSAERARTPAIRDLKPARCIHQYAAGSRSATSTMEVVVAIALLATATTLVGGFVHQVKSGLRDRELSTRCDWELVNARERIGSWPVEQITLQQIQQISLSESLTEQVANAHLSASIQKIEKPRPAMQVTLAIECDLNGQTIQPSVLTFWVPASAEERP